MDIARETEHDSITLIRQGKRLRKEKYATIAEKVSSI